MEFWTDDSSCAIFYWVTLGWDVNTCESECDSQGNLKPISCSLKWAVLLLLISFFKAKLSGDSNFLTNLCSVSALIGSLRLEFTASFFSARATKRGQKVGYVVMHKMFCAKRKCLHVWKKKKTVWLKNRNSIGEDEEVGSSFLVTS